MSPKAAISLALASLFIIVGCKTSSTQSQAKNTTTPLNQQIQEAELKETSSYPRGSMSLFDHLTLVESDGQMVRRIPYPIGQLQRWLHRGEGSFFLAFPFGRSAQKPSLDALKTYNPFLEPRLILSIDGAAASKIEVPTVFLGYRRPLNQVEVISYNPWLGRFEFQLITDYGDPAQGHKPKVIYPNREFCRSCHVFESPMITETAWNERADSHPKVAEAIADILGTGPINDFFSPAFRLNQKVRGAGALAAASFYWQACLKRQDISLTKCRLSMLQEKFKVPNSREENQKTTAISLGLSPENAKDLAVGELRDLPKPLLESFPIGDFENSNQLREYTKNLTTELNKPSFNPRNILNHRSEISSVGRPSIMGELIVRRLGFSNFGRIANALKEDLTSLKNPHFDLNLLSQEIAKRAGIGFEKVDGIGSSPPDPRQLDRIEHENSSVVAKLPGGYHLFMRYCGGCHFHEESNEPFFFLNGTFDQVRENIASYQDEILGYLQSEAKNLAMPPGSSVYFQLLEQNPQHKKEMIRLVR